MGEKVHSGQSIHIYTSEKSFRLFTDPSALSPFLILPFLGEPAELGFRPQAPEKSSGCFR